MSIYVTTKFALIFYATLALFVFKGFAANDAVSTHPSPDSKYVLRFASQAAGGDIVTIKDSSGQTVFTSEALPDFQNVISFRDNDVRWSPDSMFVAVASDEGHIGYTYVLGLKGNKFQVLDEPLVEKHYDNPYVVPIKWISGHRLIVQTTGPHAGHLSYWYRGRATVGYSLKPPYAKVLFEKIVDFNYDDE